MIQIAFMKRKNQLRDAIEYVEGAMHKPFFTNFRERTKTSLLYYKFERDIAKFRYA